MSVTTEPTEQVTLDNCAREPIHIPGAIQQHGVLLAARGQPLRLTQVSANLRDWLGLDTQAVLGQSLSTVFDGPSAIALEHTLASAADGERVPLELVSHDGQRWDGTAHHFAGVAMVELERQPPHDVYGRHDARLLGNLRRLQNATTIHALLTRAADEVRLLTGFDRVMVYRFDPDWNGEVVAESRRDDLEPFLGQHYPASDIPAQARRLYTLNWIRCIADIEYQPVPLVPALDPLTQAPLDLTHSVLRSVSPIHVQYLRNMGVQASMSISLLVDGQLAGMIACHHYAGPRLIAAGVRDISEYLGTALSWQLQVMEAAERAQSQRACLEHEAELARSMAVATDLLEGLNSPALPALTAADGAVIVLEDGVRRLGITPGLEAIQTIIDWLKEQGDHVLATAHLAAELPQAAQWSERGAGMIAVPIARELGEYLLWFRQSEVRMINWGGDPRKPVLQEDGKPDRLSPRGSFALWQQEVRDRARAWQPWEVEAASSLRRLLLGGVRRRAAQLRQMNQGLLEADRAKDAFVAMVSHELRTPLNAITGWVYLLREGHLDPERTLQAMEVIDRNVREQGQLIEDLLDISRITSGTMELVVDEIDLGAIVSAALGNVALALQAKQLDLTCTVDPLVPSIRGDSQRLRQIVANLLANAIKFTPRGGQLEVSVQQRASTLELRVRDSGQGIAADFLPHIFEPFRQQDQMHARATRGLGLGLAIVRKLVELHGGQIQARSAGKDQGAEFLVQLPVNALARTRRQQTAAAATEPSEAHALDGIRVLLVEDTDDSRELLTAVLEQWGASVIAVADANAALAVLAQQSFHLLLCDIGLPGMDGLELLRQVRALPGEGTRTVPALALTAHTQARDHDAALAAGYTAHIGKPVQPAVLMASMRKALGLD